MNKPGVTPGENLRRAIRWLDEQRRLQQDFTGHFSKQKSQRLAVEQTCVLFDLTPLEEEFLLKNFSSENSVPKKRAPKKTTSTSSEFSRNRYFTLLISGKFHITVTADL